jgi:hypothetical protein
LEDKINGFPLTETRARPFVRLPTIHSSRSKMQERH